MCPKWVPDTLSAWANITTGHVTKTGKPAGPREAVPPLEFLNNSSVLLNESMGESGQAPLEDRRILTSKKDHLLIESGCRGCSFHEFCEADLPRALLARFIEDENARVVHLLLARQFDHRVEV